MQIGRYFCTYKGFKESLKPRAFLSTEVMDVWIEKFNHEAMIICKNSARQKRRYAFTHNIVVSNILLRSFFSVFFFYLLHIVVSKILLLSSITGKIGF